MQADLDLATISEVSSRAESHITKFFVNLAFGEHLDPCKNSKFPGSMVVSILRKDLDTIKGFRPKHIPYKSCEIVAWMHPVNHQIPPLAFPDFTQRPAKQGVVPAQNLNTLDTLDFGGANGYFDVMVPMFVDWKDLDFGD